jgi:hypothetical protein
MRQTVRRPGRTWALLAAGLLLTAAAGLRAAGDDEGDARKDAETVSVTLLGIHATNEEKAHVDPALASIAEHLKRYKFNCFRLVVRKTQAVRLGKRWELPMLEGYCRRVQPTESHKDRVKMEVAWVQYVKGKDGKRKPHVHERMVMLIGKGKYLLTAVKLKKGALVGALAVK